MRKPPKPSKARRNDRHQADPRLTLEQRQLMLAMKSNPQRVAELTKLLGPASPTEH